MKRIAFALAALALAVASLPVASVPRTVAQSTGNTYTNATWGYSVTWDETIWFVVSQDDPANDTDLEVSDGLSYVRFNANEGIPISALCVTLFENDLNGDPDVSNVQPLLDPNGDAIRSTELDRAFVAFSFTVTSEGETFEIAEYLECRTLVAGQSVLLIDHITLPAAYQTEAPLVDTLLQSITIPDAQNPPTDPTPTPTAAATEEPVVTVEPTIEPTTGAETPAQTGQPGPVFVSGAWRISVVGGLRAPGINAVGLERKSGKDWIVVVADVTNWTNAPAGLSLRDIDLTFAEGGKPAKIAVSSTQNVADELRISLSDPRNEQEFRANQTRRVVLVYSVNDELTAPALTFGTTLPLADLLATEFDLGDLPSVRRPPQLVEAAVDQVADGDTLEVFIAAEDANLTVNLLSVAAPADGDCFADEAADRLSDLAGSTVFLETEGDDGSASEVNRYVWIENSDGSRTLVNHELLNGGYATYQDAGASRFSAWLQAAEQTAQTLNAGLWDACADQLASPTAEPTQEPTEVPTATATEVVVTPTEEPTEEPTETPTEEPSPTETPATVEPTLTTEPDTTPTEEAVASPSAAMFRGGPAHNGVQPGPGLGEPAKFPWTFQTGASIFSSPAVVNGVIYIGSFDGSLYALDSFSGPAKWQFNAEAGIFSSPAVADGVVYFGSEDTNFYAVNAETGRERWRVKTGAEVSSSPAVVNGIVYFGGMDTFVYALNAVSGDEIWKVRLGQAFSSPAVVNGVVYIGAAQSLFALDAKTGDEVWRAQTGGPVESSPAVTATTVFIGNDLGAVVAFDRATGAELWRFEAGEAVISSPAVANGTVYIGSNDTKVYALDAETGTEKWTFTTGDQVTSSPAIADGVVYVGSFDGFVYGLDAETGEERWRFQAGPILSSPAVADGVVYIGSGDGRVHARKPFSVFGIT